MGFAGFGFWASVFGLVLVFVSVFDVHAMGFVQRPKTKDLKTKTYFSVNASTPGKASPARNSSVAPPPVEI